MRRIIKAGAAVASLALVLSACGSDDTNTTDNSSAPVSGGNLLIWADEFTAPPMEEQCKKFADANGVTCEVVITENIRDAVGKANTSGDVPDLFSGAHDWLGEMTANGVVAPIDLGAKSTMFIEAALAATNVGGTNFGVPFAQENVALLVNKDLSPACPATLDEVEATAKALIADKKATLGLAVQMGENGDAYHWYPLFSADGGYIFGQNADGTFKTDDIGLDSAGGVAAATTLGRLAKEKVIRATAGYDNALEAFTTGKAPYWITGPWGAGDAAKTAIKDKMMVCPVPNWENPGVAGAESRPFTGVQSVYLAAKAKNATIAKVFLTDYVMTTEWMDAMFAENPRPPAWVESATKVSSDPVMAGFIEYGKKGFPMPAIPEMAVVWQDMGIAEFKAATGQNPAATMKTHADSIRKQIAAG